MPYLSFGGFSNTAGVAVFTRLNNAGDIRNIAKPELVLGDPNRRPCFGAEDWSSITRHRDTRMARLAAAPNLMPRDARNRELYAAALKPDAAEGLRSFADMIPPTDELQAVEEYGLFRSTLKRQAQLAVLAFRAGVAVSADLRLGGFDTHDNHDAANRLGPLAPRPPRRATIAYSRYLNCPRNRCRSNPPRSRIRGWLAAPSPV